MWSDSRVDCSQDRGAWETEAGGKEGELRLGSAWSVRAVGTERPHLASAVEVLPVLGEVVQGQEGVAIAGRAVAEPVALAQQAALPDHVAALHGVLQVLVLPEHLAGDTGQWEEDSQWESARHCPSRLGNHRTLGSLTALGQTAPPLPDGPGADSTPSS